MSTISRRSAFAALAGGAAALSAPAQASPEHPNIILCMADDQGWGDTGYNGHPFLQTPNLDAMSRAGLRFDRFYAGAPVCSPTRGSALTGRHPYRYGIYTANAGHMRKQEVTLAEALKTQGYSTGHFGKWHLGTLTRDIQDGRRGGRPNQLAHYSPPWENGFDACFSTEVQMPNWDPMKDQSFPAKYWTGPGEYATENLEGDDSRIIMDRAIPFIREAVVRKHPFFTVIWFHTPHEPVAAGPQYRAKYAAFSEDEQHFYGAVTALDEQIGRLRAELRRLGVADDTMLWYCADNGPEGINTTTRRRRGTAGPLRGRKRSLFEGGVRVPGLLEWPSRVREPRSTRIPCSTLDYFPTVLGALGFEVQGRPLPNDGVNLMPLIEGQMTERPRRIGFQTPGADEKAVQQRLGSPNHALIGNRYKLLSFLETGRESEDMLFDIAIDPGERYDLAAEQPDRVKTMKAE
ncbi:MAG: sulfatase-like hydrolase/transferase, partial [Bryobacterales bacterium]